MFAYIDVFVFCFLFIYIVCNAMSILPNLQCIGGNNALGLLLWTMYMLSVNLLLFDQVLFGLKQIKLSSMVISIVNVCMHFTFVCTFLFVDPIFSGRFFS